MTARRLHPLAEDYLRRLRRAGSDLAPERLRELLLEIEGYLADAIPPGASDDEALEALERLGPPGDVLEAERPGSATPDTDRRGTREWAAVILLPLGGFVFGVGWIIGLVLLWSSRLWTVRDKLIGTLIIPGGLATAVMVALLGAVGTAETQECGGVATQLNATTGAVIKRGSMHCTTTGAPSAATTAFHIALAVALLLGPILSAVYLARRAGRPASLTLRGAPLVGGGVWSP